MKEKKHEIFKRKTLTNYGTFFLVCRFIARKCMRKFHFLSDTFVINDYEPTVFISHHENLKGPIKLLLWLPFFVRTWIYSPIVDQEDCYDHFVSYTFTKRFKMSRKVAEVIALPVSHLIAWLTQSLKAIPVFRSSKKLKKTFSMTIYALKEKQPILILPDIDYSDSSVNFGKIYSGFLMIDRLFHEETGQRVRFVPIYASSQTRNIRCGEPVYFKGDKHHRMERDEVAEKLHHEISKIIQIEQNTAQIK